MVTPYAMSLLDQQGRHLDDLVLLAARGNQHLEYGDRAGAVEITAQLGNAIATLGRHELLALVALSVDRLTRVRRALEFVEQTEYANEDSDESVTWTNAELLELLAEIRGMLA